MTIQRTDLNQRPKNMKQGEVVKKSGLTQSMVSQIENGTLIPRLDTYQKYLKGCGKELKVITPRNTTNQNRTV